LEDTPEHVGAVALKEWLRSEEWMRASDMLAIDRVALGALATFGRRSRRASVTRSLIE
jgi:hypothetical protein